jgi:hypothetical protein
VAASSTATRKPRVSLSDMEVADPLRENNTVKIDGRQATG